MSNFINDTSIPPVGGGGLGGTIRKIVSLFL